MTVNERTTCFSSLSRNSTLGPTMHIRVEGDSSASSPAMAMADALSTLCADVRVHAHLSPQSSFRSLSPSPSPMKAAMPIPRDATPKWRDSGTSTPPQKTHQLRRPRGFNTGSTSPSPSPSPYSSQLHDSDDALSQLTASWIAPSSTSTSTSTSATNTTDVIPTPTTSFLSRDKAPSTLASAGGLAMIGRVSPAPRSRIKMGDGEITTYPTSFGRTTSMTSTMRVGAAIVAM